MKIYIKSLLIFTAFIFLSCEDVIEVDVPTGQTRLVVEASLDWQKGTLGNNQTIILSTSTPYFSTNTSTSVTGASVKVKNVNTNEAFVFTDQNDGTYTTSSFVPIVGDTYNLEILYNNETYTATETLTTVPEIKAIIQTASGGFDSEFLEVNVYFDDPANEENYYLLSYYEAGDLFPYFEDISDEFSNGNEIHDFFEKDDDEDNNEMAFEPGDIVDINLYGISQGYYNYIRLLLEQYYSGGDPFSSNAAQIKGNCINTTNQENYAFGYFRVNQVEKASYTFQ